MKIDITQKIMRIDDKPFENPETKLPYTLKDVMIEAVLAPKEKDSEKEKYDKYDLYKKLKVANKEADLTVDEVSKIKKLIVEIKPPLVCGQTRDMLEGGKV